MVEIMLSEHTQEVTVINKDKPLKNKWPKNMASIIMDCKGRHKTGFRPPRDNVITCKINMVLLQSLFC